ncbi:MAG: CotH kinase family protein [Planctomycetaceae bacterium]|nr:CotH kinase family protein [Planctomycetaceae bacterium]
MQRERELVKQFDKDDDGRLNKDERQAARDSMKSDGGRRGGFGPPPGGPGGPGGRGPFGQQSEPGKPGPRVSPDEITPIDAPLYDPQILRTIFIDFDHKDWEAELADFNNTDVEVPATLTVDGKKYPNVGVHFRGMSSYMMIPAGSKRSLSLSLDFVDSKQRLYGYKSLNLLNAHEDDSFLNTVLYSDIARPHLPTPKANFVKVVINGESWGVYVNVQQFNKEFLAENFPSTKGTRWKVTGSPMGGGGLEYLGDNVEDYKRRYDMKTDDAKAWKALIKLCKTLNETPPDKLEAALEPMLDIDGLLWFLALDNALINCDGYWIRASDYSLFLDAKGKFRILPHDMNEAFRAPMGPGFGFGPGGGPPGRGGFGGAPPGGGRPGEARGEQRRPDDRGANGERPNGPRPGDNARPGGPSFDLDPLIGLDDARKPLRSKVLAVPSLRTRYLQHVHTIADKSLDWKTLGPVVAQYRSLIGKEIEADTRKLSSFADFQKATADVAAKDSEEPRRFGPQHSPLRTFADQRRQFLLNHEAVKAAMKD